jgi:hypothetical protein
VLTHLRMSRRLAQLLSALCVVSAIVIGGLVASSAPARPFGAVTPHLSVSQMTTTLSQGESAIVRTLKPLCGSGSGEC